MHEIDVCMLKNKHLLKGNVEFTMQYSRKDFIKRRDKGVLKGRVLSAHSAATGAGFNAS